MIGRCTTTTTAWLLLLLCVAVSADSTSHSSFFWEALGQPQDTTTGSTTGSATVRKFSASNDPAVLNVHVVPHTHDDVGWRKTVDQYYHGRNTSIDERGFVGRILSTTLAALLQNDARTFTYVESKFLHTWWTTTASVEQRAALRGLIHNDDDDPPQFSLVNGGWSMHDEAAPHYVGMIDQTSTGHDFLRRALNVTPIIGWQLDPFGHSATHADFCHRWGMDALYFGRIDYQDLELRRQEQRCEGLWRPDPNPYSGDQDHDDSSQNEDDEDDDTNNSSNNNNTTDDDTSIFMGLTGSYGGNYGPPSWDFMFDTLYQDSVTPLTVMNETQFHATLLQFLQLTARQARETATNDVMMTMGSDFTFSHAEYYFGNLDLLLHSIMLGQEWNVWNISDIFGNDAGIERVNVFYSTPDYYTQRKYQQTQQYYTENNQELRQHENINRQEQQQPQPGLRKQPPGSSSSSSHRQHDKNDQSSSSASGNSLWTTKTDDFFPYSDCPHCFWTGYFTSRTAFKRLERASSAFLQAARQLDVLGLLALGKTEGNKEPPFWTAETHPLFALEDALGVAQHHDAVSGTAMQHVSDDYTLRIRRGLERAAAHIQSIVMKQIFPAHENNNKNNNKLRSDLPQHLQLYCPSSLSKATFRTYGGDDSLPGFCNQYLDDPASYTSKDRDLFVMVYNPLANVRNWTVRVAARDAGLYQIERMDDTTAEKDASTTVVLSRSQDDDEYQIVEFTALNLRPLGLTTYRISYSGPSPQDHKQVALESSKFVQAMNAATIAISNGQDLVVTFDRQSGQMQTIGDVEVFAEWGYYVPYDAFFDGDGQNSGAYIFRPSQANQTLKMMQPCPEVQFIPTSVGVEVHTSYGDDPNNCWVQQIVKLVEGHPWIEFEYTVGPVPIENGRGKEVVSRFVASGIGNNGVFYTDSNGRAFLKRTRDYRPSWNYSEIYEPVAGNYYPVNAAIYMEDANASLAVLTDRSRGGSSILDGTLEVMVQRRTVADDSRGVDEALNETAGGMTPYPPYGNATRVGQGVVVSGVHRIMVGGGYAGAKLSRSAMDQVFAEPLVLAGSAAQSTTPLDDSVAAKRQRNRKPTNHELDWRPSFSMLSALATLPPNVFLVTLMKLYDFEPASNSTNQSLLRIRLGHQYGPGEDETGFSKPVQVDLNELFDPSRLAILSVTEMTLSGNQKWSDFIERKYNWVDPTKGRDEGSLNQRQMGDDDDDDDDENGNVIMLKPLDIQTFHVLVEQPETVQVTSY